MKIKDIKNKKSIWILWFGREGKSTLKFLQKIWCKNITILDKNKIEDFNWNTKKITWENYLDNLKDFDLIIKTPWISLYNEKILKHKEKIIDQTQIFFENYSWKVIWVTATKGKSTIVTLAYNILKRAWHKTKLVWNIWKPVLDEIDIEKDNYDYIVYELSSYMLEGFKPKLHIAILWNIYPDHLDWHINYKNYKKAKLNIIKQSETKLVNIDLKKESISDKEISKTENQEKKPRNISDVQFFWTSWKYSYKSWEFFIENNKVFDNKKILLKWDHNMINICSILWFCDILWIKREVLENELRTFKWLKHRIENIWIYNWITFIDDAISTTPESTIEAIKTFWEKIWTIFLWWTDRWYKFNNLIEQLKKYSIKNIVLFPESWEKIWELLDNSFNKINTKSMKEAINFALKECKKDEICLLSCASPSYSLWKNFEEKWDEFKKEIKKHTK